MKKILTVSLFAMMAVSAANADIASTKYVGDQITATAGTLSNLTTTEKGNLVGAINELKDDMGTMQGGIADTIDPLASRLTAAESNITSLQSGKADKATTLAGYGIADAYTKTYMDGELNKKQNNLSDDQKAAVNSGITSAGVTQITTNKNAINTINNSDVMKSGITSAGVTQITTNKNAITTLNANDQTEGSVAYQVKALADGAVATNTASINTINNSAVMKSGITSAGVTQITTNKTAIDTINKGAVMTSGITSAKVGIYDGYADKISQNKSAITTLNANDQTAGSVAYQVKALADGAVATNTASINTINNSAVMKSGVTAKVVESVGTHTTDINTIKASDVMKSGVTAAVVAKANSAMQEENLKALESWTTGQCAEPTVTCSLISKGGKIAWEVVTY